MGQAKRRGSFEFRKAQALATKQKYLQLVNEKIPGMKEKSEANKSRRLPRHLMLMAIPIMANLPTPTKKEGAE